MTNPDMEALIERLEAPLVWQSLASDDAEWEIRSDPFKAAAALRALKEKVKVLEIDAARYRYLRDGNAQDPWAACVNGDEELDKLCDESMAYVALQGYTHE